MSASQDSILKKFRCPRGKKCRRSELNTCPFTHSKGRIVPQNICRDFLFGECNNQTASGDVACCRTGFHPAIDDLDSLSGYFRKISLSLMAVQTRNCSIQPTVVSNGNSSANPPADIGPINGEPSGTSNCLCRENPPQSSPLFALFESCVHSTCGYCVLQWRNGEKRFRCGFTGCSVKSRRFIFWPAPYLSEDQKMKLIQLQDQQIMRDVENHAQE